MPPLSPAFSVRQGLLEGNEEEVYKRLAGARVTQGGEGASFSIGDEPNPLVPGQDILANIDHVDHRVHQPEGLAMGQRVLQHL